MKPFVSFCCLLILACLNGRPASVTLNPNADTTISEGSRANTSPTSATMIVGRLAGMGGTAKCRDLLRFDLSSIPSNVTVTSVTLTVVVTRNHFGGTDTHGLHRLNAPWTELGATWDTSGFGAWSAGSFEEAPDSTIGLGLGTFTFPSTPAMINTVQAWVTNATSNNGWILISGEEETAGNARRVSSREAASGKPTLIVQYTTPPMPPPSPVISRPAIVTNQFVFSFVAAAGHSYTVEFKDNLSVSNWTTHVVFPAPAQQTNLTVVSSLNSNRFFRVRAD